MTPSRGQAKSNMDSPLTVCHAVKAGYSSLRGIVDATSLMA